MADGAPFVVSFTHEDGSPATPEADDPDDDAPAPRELIAAAANGGRLVFCGHGRERCDRCAADHRLGNYVASTPGCDAIAACGGRAETCRSVLILLRASRGRH